MCSWRAMDRLWALESCRVLWNGETEAQENLRSASVCIGLHRSASCTLNSMLFCLASFQTRIFDKDWHTMMVHGIPSCFLESACHQLWTEHVLKFVTTNKAVVVVVIMVIKSRQFHGDGRTTSSTKKDENSKIAKQPSKARQMPRLRREMDQCHLSPSWWPLKFLKKSKVF